MSVVPVGQMEFTEALRILFWCPSCSARSCCTFGTRDRLPNPVDWNGRLIVITGPPPRLTVPPSRFDGRNFTRRTTGTAMRLVEEVKVDAEDLEAVWFMATAFHPSMDWLTPA